MKTLNKIANYLPEAQINPGNSDYPKHIDFGRFRIFETGPDHVRILINDAYANPQVLFPEMSFAKALEFMFHTTTGGMIDLEIERILERNKDEKKVRKILSLVS